MPTDRRCPLRPRQPRSVRATMAWRLRPLAMALALAFPLGGHAAGANGPLPSTHAGTANPGVQVGHTLTINQGTARQIYRWKSFDIDSGYTVTFNMAGTGYAALNRVVPAAGQSIATINPTQILGTLNATNGGEIYIINPNGIIFGQGAQVNVGSLVASTLDIRDSDFLGGLNSITDTSPTFSWRYTDGQDAALTPLYSADAVVRVDAGASIATTSGGRVFLFAPKVVNSGTISTPHGQTVLAAGSEVYLNNAAREPIYASEANASIPALRGLLVEVNPGSSVNQASVLSADPGQVDKGTATNLGTILSDYGNTTIVAAAVNQSGRIRATSSVSENGSVFLLARSDVTATTTAGGATKRATTGGTLTISHLDDEHPGTIELPVDTASDTITGSSTFTAPRVELSGQTIRLGDNTSIVAHGGIVRARAEATPIYLDGATGSNDPTNAQTSTLGADGKAANAQATISIGRNAVIDVSGTTNTEVEGTRNYLTTQALGKIDLADSATQKDGVLYLSTPTLDTRLSSEIVDVAKLNGTLGRTASEMLSAGGSINLVSTGSVVTDASSTLDVSGGQVAYTAVTAADNIKLTLLKDSAGKLYTLNNAPEDRTYTMVDARLTPTVKQAAYTEGKAGGALNISASQVVLDGQVKGTTVKGVRQASGQDASAKVATLNVNVLANASTTTAQTDLLNRLNLRLTAAATGVDASYWQMDDSWRQLDSDAGSRISGKALHGGVGHIALTTQGSASVEAGVDLSFAPQTNFALTTTDLLGVVGSLGFNTGYASAGGSISLVTAGLLTVADQVSLDVAGRYVNLYRDGALASRLGTQGGDITLKGTRGVSLGDGGTLDVSGGAVLSASGKLSVRDAGSLTVAANADGSVTGSVLHLGKAMRGQAVATGSTVARGGSLTLTADSVEIGGDKLLGAALWLTPEFFSQGGFSSYDIGGAQALQVDAGVTLSPRQASWVLPGGKSWLTLGTGTALGSALQSLVEPLAWRGATDLTLRTMSGASALHSGALTVASGAVIHADAGASVQLLARGRLLDLEGSIVAHGGEVTLSLQNDLSMSGKTPSQAAAELGTLWLGEGSLIDVSGTTVLTPTVNGLRQGTLLDGGSVNLATTKTGEGLGAYIVMQEGARIDLRGATDTLFIDTATRTGTRLLSTALASEGGSLSISAPRGALLEGTVLAQGGNASAAAGSLSLSVLPVGTERTADYAAALPDALRITLRQDRTSASAGLRASQAPQLVTLARYGQASVSAGWLDAAGFADVSLSAFDRIDAVGTATISATRSLSLSAPVYALTGLGADDTLTLAAPLVVWGNVTQNQVAGGVSEVASNQARLRIEANLARLTGVSTLQGVRTFSVASRGDTQLAGSNVATSSDGEPALTQTGDTRPVGELRTSGDVEIEAAQVYPVSDERYTIDAGQGTVRFGVGNASAGLPLSAGGSLTVKAATIEQDGVVRAPLGTLAFEATDVRFGAGSVTSVSGSGLTVPFGSTVDGTLTIDDVERLALMSKSITIKTSGSAKVADGALIDLSGGGELQAYEFISGTGGTVNKYLDGSGYYAIVPTASANATGYADYSHLLSGGTGATGLAAGQQITLGEGSGLPAGTYTLMPAAYGQLPGAYLVKADTARAGAASMDAAALKLSDGSYSVAGYLSSAGTAYRSATAMRFIVMSQGVAAKTTEVKTTSLSSYFSAQAQRAGTASPLLTRDAGALRFITSSLDLAANTLRFNRDDEAALGGTLEIAASHIRVSDDPGPQTGPDGLPVLTLSAQALSSSGAQNLVLGATTSSTVDDNGLRTLDVLAQDITIDRSDTSALTAGDITLVALDRIDLKDGASLVAQGSQGAPAYATSGSGASVRVSADADATVVRTGVDGGSTGTVTIGLDTRLQGRGITVEAAGTALIDGSSRIEASSMTIGSQRMVLGQPDAAAQQGAFVYTDALAAQLAGIGRQVLRSYSSIDIHHASEPLTIGGDALGSLVLDTGAINVLGSGGTVTLKAGSVTLQNTSNTDTLTTASPGGASELRIEARSGDAFIGSGLSGEDGTGLVHIAGADSVGIEAARSIVARGQGGLTTEGDLQLSGTSVTAQGAANTLLDATGTLTVDTLAGGATATASAGLGASLQLHASRIAQNGRIELPSGRLTLTATSADADALSFGATSLTSVAGTRQTLASGTAYTSGGTVQAVADNGGIQVADGATLDVSAFVEKDTSGTVTAVGGDAGSLSFLAANGDVELAGHLRGLAGTQADANGIEREGGQLSVDARNAQDLARLAQTLAREEDGSSRTANFAGSLTLRNREGEQTLASGTTLRASNINLVSDHGALTIDGTLNADGAQGGQVRLSAAVDDAQQTALRLGASAVISARALRASNATTEYNGGTVSLNAQQGRLVLSQDALIDVSPTAASDDAGTVARTVQTYGGTVTMRARQTGDSVDVAAIDVEDGVDAGHTIVAGARRVQVEAFKTYTAGSATTVLKNNIGGNAATLAASGGTLQARLAALAATPVSVVAGAEITASGDFSLSSAWNLWSATNYRPVNLTIRAEGDLNITASLSDGFNTANIAQTGAASSFTLVGGADTDSADVLATIDGAGDVNIGGGATVQVRSTTGDIRIAAGKDINLLSGKAAVYTTGEPISLASLNTFVAPSSINVTGLRQLYTGSSASYYKWLMTTGATSSNVRPGSATNPFVAGTAATLFYDQGGAVSLRARQNINGYETSSDESVSPSAWKYEFYDTASGQTLWWSRYDLYTQGVASFGGGDVRLSAGQDIVDAQVDATGSGYLSADGSRTAYGAGNLRIEAGRDIVGGNVVAEGRTLRVTAGRSLTGADTGSGLSRDHGLGVWIGNTTATIQAAQDVALNGLGNAGRAAQFLADPNVSTTLDIDAYTRSLLAAHSMAMWTHGVADVSSAGGQVSLATVGNELAGGVVQALPGTYKSGGSGCETCATPDLQPALLSISAPSGSLTVHGALTQKLAATGLSGLTLLAGQDLDFHSTLTQTASQAGQEAGTGVLLGVDPSGVERRQNLLVAASGDVAFDSLVDLARSTLVQAGRDIRAAADAPITLQHQGATEISALEAGRDVALLGQHSGLTLRGPGDLLVAAGRDVDLGTSAGIVANGNQDNGALPAGSANVSVMAGVSLLPGGTDFRQAIAQGYAQDPAALIRLLAALNAGTLPEDAALQAAQLTLRDLAARSPTARAEGLRGLLGDADYNDILIAFVKARTGLGTVSAGQAQSLFDAMDSGQQATLLQADSTLSAVRTHYRSLDFVRQQQAAFDGQSVSSRLAALETALGSDAYNRRLLAYVRSVTNDSSLSLPTALNRFGELDATAQAGLISAAAPDLVAAFTARPFERQVLELQQALQADVRAAGRASVAADTVAGQQAAYALANAAIAQVLPGERAQGHLSMAVSQIKTTQDSDVALLVPGGLVNAGLTSGATSDKTADQLGIVTVAGGDISAITSGDFLVNASRVFTVGEGDMLIWSSRGNIDAGKGAKTVVGAPPPTYYIDATGHLAINTSASYAGSGIAVLGANSVLDLYAPFGIIDSGDAGIRAGKAYLNADKVLCKVCGLSSQVAISLPAPAAPVAINFSLSASPKAGIDGASAGQDEDEDRKKRRASVQVDFLGYGEGEGDPPTSR